MTRKDYEAIAKAIKSSTSGQHGMENWIIKGVLVDLVADYFEANNPKFNRDKFRQACYTE